MRRKKIFLFFVLWAEKIRTFGENFSARSKLHFTSPGEESQQNLFFNRKSKLFIDFFQIGNKNREFWKKNVQQGCQDCILCVQRNVLKIFGLFDTIKQLTNFRTITEKFFGFWAIKHWQGSQDCILRVQGNTLSLSVEKRIVFLPVKNFEEKHFGIFFEILWQDVKTAFQVTSGKFWGKINLWKKSFSKVSDF